MVENIFHFWGSHPWCPRRDPMTTKKIQTCGATHVLFAYVSSKTRLTFLIFGKKQFAQKKTLDATADPYKVGGVPRQSSSASFS